MPQYHSIEEMFVQDFLSILKLKDQETSIHLTSHFLPQDEYAQAIGYLRAIREIKQEFADILNTYFPRN
jgi:hypothetical protein